MNVTEQTELEKKNYPKQENIKEKEIITKT